MDDRYGKPLKIRPRWRAEAMRVTLEPGCESLLGEWSGGAVRFSRSTGRGGDSPRTSLTLAVVPFPGCLKPDFAEAGDWVVRTGEDRYSVMHDLDFERDWEAEGDA